MKYERLSGDENAQITSLAMQVVDVVANSPLTVGNTTIAMGQAIWIVLLTVCKTRDEFKECQRAIIVALDTNADMICQTAVEMGKLK